ncbi:MAG: MATE family efflux transporter, partial [Peptococcaceae bacterium]|nr:MATE family efflux transporter [Peptococcaceae bacterium]
MVDLLKDSPKQLFSKYLVPSVSATMVTSIYILADSIMIGKGIGELAIAALNIVLPLFNIMFGTGALFGVGGAV